jgi:queuine tRNA-ribosyltransferase
MNIRNAKYRNDFLPIDENNFSPISNQYSKSYLHHLFKTNEILGLRIATEHNLKFYTHLMKLIRNKIKQNQFEKWAQEFLKRYNNE